MGGSKGRDNKVVSSVNPQDHGTGIVDTEPPWLLVIRKKESRVKYLVAVVRGEIWVVVF